MTSNRVQNRAAFALMPQNRGTEIHQIVNTFKRSRGSIYVLMVITEVILVSRISHTPKTARRLLKAFQKQSK